MISTAFNKNRPSSPFILNKTFDFDSNDQNGIKFSFKFIHYFLIFNKQCNRTKHK